MTTYITAVGVQQFTITIASGNTTGTATINAVGSGAFILYGGASGLGPSQPNESFAGLSLTNSTTITATRNTGTSGTVIVSGCIVDGDTTNLIKSVQTGIITIANTATSGTATISAVTNSNSAVHFMGMSSSNSTFAYSNEEAILSLSGTTVTATRRASVGTLTVYYEIIEFQGSTLNQSIQNISATSSSSVTSYTASLSSVNTANAFIIYAGSSTSGAGGNGAIVKQYGSLTNGTTLTVNVNTANAGTKTYNCSVIEFVSGLLQSNIQRGTTTVTSGNISNTSSITSVSLPDSAITWLGNITTSTTTTTSVVEAYGSLISGTVVTVAKDSTNQQITGSWEILEFPPNNSGSVGSASGSSTVSGIGGALVLSVGSSTGNSTTSAISAVSFSSVGSISGSSSVMAFAGGTSPAVGTAVGNSSVNAIGSSIFTSVGAIIGTAAVTGTGLSLNTAVGTAVGTSTMTGSPLYSVLGVGSIVGMSTVSATSITKIFDYESVLAFMGNAPVNSTGIMNNTPISVMGNF